MRSYRGIVACGVLRFRHHAGQQHEGEHHYFGRDSVDESECLAAQLFGFLKHTFTFLVNILFVCDLIQVRLYAVAEESRENIECPDQEQARADKRHYRLGDAVLARVHLDVYLTNGHDDVNPGYGATDILDIEHHRHHEVVHRGQRVRSPAIVHAAAFGKSRVGEREAQRT